MEITIIKGSLDNLKECTDALINSELGKRYFSAEGSARRALEEGFKKEEIYVALDNNQNCMGFMWYILNGIFHSYPYLHIIAVKEEYRNQGIGSKLLKSFEDCCFNNTMKIFLVVADFNQKAKMLYERLGYIEVGSIPNLYREGITEHLMMKSRDTGIHQGQR